MVFELDTKDMERHAVELRLYIDKARRRFDKAQLGDQFEKIVKNVLAQTETQMSELNSVRIDSVNEDSARRLSSFLENLVNKCKSPEQHSALQNTLRSSLHQARRTSVLTGSTTEAISEQICYFCAGSPNTNNAQQSASDLHHLIHQLATMQQLLTPPSSIEGPSPPLDKARNGSSAAQRVPNQRHHASLSGSSGQPSPDDGQPAEAEIEPQQEQELQDVVTDAADSITDSLDSNASKVLQIILDVEDDNENRGPDKESDKNKDSNNDTSKQFSDSGTQAEVIPGTPEEDEQLDDAHEDSMHEWFENLNQTALQVQRASTPVSSSKSNSKKGSKKDNEALIYKRFSNIKYTIEKRDQKDSKIKNFDMKRRTNHSLNSSREGQTSQYSQQIQSSNTVDNEDDNGSTNFLQTSATQPVRSSLIVKSKPKRGRPKGQNSKHLSSNDSSSSSKNKRCKV